MTEKLEITKKLQDENARLKKKERCDYKHHVLVNPNTSASASAVCYSVYDCENCRLFKQSEVTEKLEEISKLQG